MIFISIHTWAFFTANVTETNFNAKRAVSYGGSGSKYRTFFKRDRGTQHHLLPGKLHKFF